MKNLNDTIGNRTRDLPPSDAVPQPSAPLRTSILETRNHETLSQAVLFCQQQVADMVNMLKEICMQGKRSLNLWTDTAEYRDSLVFILCSCVPVFV
jgi:hypothetical protein